MSIQFSIRYDREPTEPLNPVVYAFDPEGKLLGSAPVEKGHAHLTLDPKQVSTARIFIGPSLEKTDHKPTLALMRRVRAHEPVWKYNASAEIQNLGMITEDIWRWWPICFCHILGQVVRPVVNSADGSTINMPVCKARVHICEIESLFEVIYRLPDDVLSRLSQELIAVVTQPHPPIPDPGPFRFASNVIDPTPEAIARMNVRTPAQSGFTSNLSRVALNPQPLPPGERAKLSAAINPQPLPPEALSIHTEMIAALSSPSSVTVRQALVSNLSWIRLYLCWWDWLWPYFYECEEVAVLDTNDQGRFETFLFESCFDDQESLYFWVEYNLGGLWTTVYDPGLWCGTYWNYVCGTSVTLIVTDPRVPWCGDLPSLPGKQVAIITIGNNIGMDQIQRSSAGANEGLTTDGAPFGGSLEPHVWFGDDLIPSGITHFRWSYRKKGSSMDCSGSDWAVIDTKVIRHYAVVASDGTLTFVPYPLGPFPNPLDSKPFFEIQQKLAPGGNSWAPMVDARENSASAFLLSYLLNGGDAAAAAGLYEFKLELFKSTGESINLTDNSVALKTADGAGPFGSGTVTTTAVAAGSDRACTDGTGDILAFRLVLHIDNEPCYANINETKVGSTSAGPCGFIDYVTLSDLATISFVASHPHNFATFGFDLTRGSSGSIDVASGPVSLPTDGFSLTNPPGLFSKNVAVSTLLGGCPRAAFAETLEVYATATDGWSTLSYLNAGAVPKAFALEPSS